MNPRASFGLKKRCKHRGTEFTSSAQPIKPSPRVRRSFTRRRIKISKEEAFTFVKRAAKEEGLFIGISSGASLAAVNQKLNEFTIGARILTFCYDTGERYLSTDGLF